ncbi:hypothetical protein BDY24DRAFT_265966 [Mrakia frigida]|uniref:BTB/POZ domain-containing protein n=1 Tax=Mrakia frigida TaxID=29902 RepID=UPI003FCBFFD7
MSYTPSTSSPFRHNSFSASRGSSSPSSQHQQAASSSSFRPSSSVSSSLGRGSVLGGGAQAAEETTKQSNIIVFEWVVEDLKALNQAIQSYLPEDPEHPSHNHEILQPGPCIGNGSFKLDVVFEPLDQPLPPTTSSTPTMQDFASGLDLREGGGEQQEQDQEQERAVQTLCVYLGTLSGESRSHWEFPASIMVGIKSIEQPIGARHSPVKWLWNYWEEDWSFQPDTCFWRAQLPTLSSLLANPSVEEQDAFVLVVQIHTPFGGERLVLPELPREAWVPRTLLTAMENSLDNDKTGDVKFITRERYDPSLLSSNFNSLSLSTSNQSTPTSASTSVASSAAAAAASLSNPHPNMVSRKRVVWAHSDVLKARSEYFETMLSGAFAEGRDSGGRVGGDGHGEGRGQVHEVNLEGTDFTTVYWLLKYLYTNSLEFDTVEDVRTIYQLANVKNSSSRPTGSQEWAWQSVWSPPTRAPSGGEDDLDLDCRTIASVSSSAGSFEAGRGSSARAGGRLFKRGSSVSTRGGGGGGGGGGGIEGKITGSGSTSATSLGRQQQQQQQANLPYSHRPRGTIFSATPSSSSSPTKPSSIPIPSSSRTQTLGTTTAGSRQPQQHPSSSSSSSTSRGGGGGGQGLTLSPHPSPQLLTPHRPSSTHHLPFPPPSSSSVSHSQPLSDPHSHPTPPPPPASALAIYHIASRYQLHDLQHLARQHILSRLNLSNAMPFLLASSMYDELHSEIEEWLVGHFEVVKGTEEFGRCFGEVSGGVWGEDGGRVLLSLCGRLESPARR